MLFYRGSNLDTLLLAFVFAIVACEVAIRTKKHIHQPLGASVKQDDIEEDEEEKVAPVTSHHEVARFSDPNYLHYGRAIDNMKEALRRDMENGKKKDPYMRSVRK